MRKYPKSLADAIKEIKKLRASVAAADAARENFRQKFNSEYGARLAAEKDAKTTQEKFADLKERLQASETNAARLQGYMDRVREDDLVRDGVIEVEDGMGKRLVPKRYPEHYSRHDSFMNGGLESIAMRAAQQKHWTSY